MKKVPTANKLIRENNTLVLHKVEYVSYKETRALMVEFAKLHVEAALEQVRYNVEINDFDEHGQYSPCVDEPSILNAYPLDNIK